MAYTSTEQVRIHLGSSYPLIARITDQPLVMNGTDYIQFYGAAVDATSVKVKSLRTQTPVRTSITLTSGDNSFASSPVVAQSVVVASDTSLGTVYEENTDYIILYDTGVMRLKSGGVLATGITVVVFYLAAGLYVNGTDYQLRADRGEIRRLSAGNIADGESVQLDYCPQFEQFNDDLVNSAVATANGMIENEVDPERQFEADPALNMAATYRAMKIICRAAAARRLSLAAGDDRSALTWLRLAESFASQSHSLLATFVPSRPEPSSPRHT